MYAASSLVRGAGAEAGAGAGLPAGAGAGAGAELLAREELLAEAGAKLLAAAGA